MSAREVVMNNTNYEKLTSRIKIAEGFRPSAYQDSLGYWTIGYGALIDAKKGGKLSEKICSYILDEQIKEAAEGLKKFDWFVMQDEVRQGVLIELCFNLGLTGLLLFKNMIACLDNKNYKAASTALSDSKWARQVQPSRVADIKKRLETGSYEA